jgi:hypothetical protein
MSGVSVRTRVVKNGTNGWYWEVLAGAREVLDRGVALSLEGARARADQVKMLAARELEAR